MAPDYSAIVAPNDQVTDRRPRTNDAGSESATTADPVIQTNTAIMPAKRFIDDSFPTAWAYPSRCRRTRRNLPWRIATPEFESLSLPLPLNVRTVSPCPEQGQVGCDPGRRAPDIPARGVQLASTEEVEAAGVTHPGMAAALCLMFKAWRRGQRPGRSAAGQPGRST